jgi:hypothetical protein
MPESASHPMLVWRWRNGRQPASLLLPDQAEDQPEMPALHVDCLKMSQRCIEDLRLRRFLIELLSSTRLEIDVRRLLCHSSLLS